MPRPGRFFAWPDYGCALLVALAALLLYTCTLGPTITGEDSGEFVAAAYTLGIPHPPGYPLYCLIGHLFTYLPMGEVAWRVNFMSAFFGAAAVFIVSLLVVCLTRNRFAAVGAGLALTCSRELWAQSVIAEVYSMNAFFFALCLLLLLLWREARRPRQLYVFAVLFGLGMTVHYTFALLAPLFALYVFCTDRCIPVQALRGKQLRLATYPMLCLVASATFLLVFLYLPIRSRTNPPVDWGNPETLENMYHVIRRTQFEFMFHQYPRSVARLLGQLAVYGRFWLGEFLPLGALIGVWGLLVLLRRRPGYAMMLLGSALAVVVGFCYWQNFEQTREWLWVMRVFGIPAYMVTAVGIGVGLETLWRRGGGFRAAAVLVAVLVVAGPLGAHWRRNDKSDYFWTRDYGVNILESLPPDAIYVSQSDHGSFSVLYLQAVKGMRPDVENLRTYGYVSSPLFDDMPEDMRARIGEFPKRRHEPDIFAWLLENTDRPLYLASPRPVPLPGVRVVPAGLLFRVLRPNEEPSGRDYWGEYRWHTLAAEDTRGDYTAEAIRYEIALAKAKAALITARGAAPDTVAAKHDKARAHIEDALCAYGRDPVVLNNVGVICARFGLYHDGYAYFREALDLLPTLEEAQHNLARIFHKISVAPANRTPYQAFSAVAAICGSGFIKDNARRGGHFHGMPGVRKQACFRVYPQHHDVIRLTIGNHQEGAVRGNVEVAWCPSARRRLANA